MLSICIPVFNFDVRQLVSDLHKQAVESAVPFEIIVIDDCSSNIAIKLENKEIQQHPNVLYFENLINRGRSGTRNDLADKATMPYLIFLDGDSKVISPDFISNYLKYTHPDAVVCGGTAYIHQSLSAQNKLRWVYGIKREQRSASFRNKNPNKSFSTFNFLIETKVFNKIRFDEELKGYGHEDTLFGHTLEVHNITIRHIDNPLAHIGLESSQDFLEKTRHGVENLLFLVTSGKISNDESITLLQWHKKISSTGTQPFFRFVFQLFEPFLRNQLLGNNPTIFLLDIYKLGYISTIN